MRSDRAVLAAVALFASFALPVVAQEMPPNAPHYVKSLKAPKLEVRFLDFKWDQEAFDTLRAGGTHKIGSRSWVLARLVLTKNPMRWEGKIVPVGPAILILNPAQAGGTPTVELRAVDMREIFVDMNVVAEPPPGETHYKGPARLSPVEKKAARLEVRLNETKDGPPPPGRRAAASEQRPEPPRNRGFGRPSRSSLKSTRAPRGSGLRRRGRRRKGIGCRGAPAPPRGG